MRRILFLVGVALTFGMIGGAGLLSFSSPARAWFSGRPMVSMGAIRNSGVFETYGGTPSAGRPIPVYEVSAPQAAGATADLVEATARMTPADFVVPITVDGTTVADYWVRWRGPIPTYSYPLPGGVAREYEIARSRAAGPGALRGMVRVDGAVTLWALVDGPDEKDYVLIWPTSMGIVIDKQAPDGLAPGQAYDREEFLGYIKSEIR